MEFRFDSVIDERKPESLKLEKKKVAFVFKLTGNFDFALASMLMDLKRTQSRLPDEIIVFHDGIPLESKNLLYSILPVRFVKYKFPIKSPSVRFSRTVRHFTPLVFASFECLRLLEEFDTVIQLDYDQVILDDISELAVGSFSIRACQLNATVRVMLRREISGYDLNQRGFITLGFGSDLTNYQELYDFCYQELRRNANRLIMPEMAIFAFMVEKFGIQIDFVPLEVYTPHPRDATAKAKVLHGHSQPKFWNGLANAQWQANYKHWLEMGGRPYRSGRLFDEIRRMRAVLLS